VNYHSFLFQNKSLKFLLDYDKLFFNLKLFKESILMKNKE